MAQKLSPYKLSKMMALYFEGDSQLQIANKLEINQATISLHLSKLKALAEEQGLKAAAKEYGIMDEVESLHSLAAELKKAKLTAEEAKVGLKMELLFQKFGINQEDYKDLIQAYTKIKNEGFINSAVKLHKLEQSTGITHEEIVAQSASTYEHLKKAQQDLNTVTGKLNTTKGELASMEKQKELATHDLEKHKQQIGVDMNRLKHVEDLALALKEGGISDKELQNYVQRQQVLNKAGIGIDTFVTILEKAKVLTSQDHGEELLQMLAEYGSLTEAKKALQSKVQSLEKEAHGLEQRAKLKGKIEGEIAKLNADKNSLNAHVAQLNDQKNELYQIQSAIGSLAEKKAKLEQEANELEGHQDILSDDIKAKEQKVGHLKELESKHDTVLASLSEIQAKLDQEKERWEVFESFLGLVNSGALAELEKFAEELPSLLKEVKQGKYSPELLTKFILRELIGDTLQLLRCTFCQVKFTVDKPSKLGSYQCPNCGLSHTVTTDKDALAILKMELFPPKQQQFIAVQKAGPIHKQPAPDGKDNG